MIKTKKCTKCGKEFPLTPLYFHCKNKSKGGFVSRCKVCISRQGVQYRKENIDKSRAYGKEYYKNNKEKVLACHAKYRQVNSEKIRIANKKYRKANPEKTRASRRKHQAKKCATLKGNLNHRMSSMVRYSLNGNKRGNSWERLIGYTVNELKEHLEKQFTDGMAWDNRSEWQIDHIIPIAAFNFTKPCHTDFKRCWALKNLQPLWAKDNQSKHAKLKNHFQPTLF